MVTCIEERDENVQQCYFSLKDDIFGVDNKIIGIKIFNAALLQQHGYDTDFTFACDRVFRKKVEEHGLLQINLGSLCIGYHQKHMGPIDPFLRQFHYFCMISLFYFFV